MGTTAVGLVVCLLVGASLGIGFGVAVASANEVPLAEAGLDQSARTNATVYLDAGGSLDPDGEIAQYEWRIERPDGTAGTPACGSCVTTEFVPRQAGRYEVTVTVTDDDGATASDTLYVDVRDRAPPEVTLSGPATLAVGAPGSFEATATAGEAAVSSVAWYVNDSTVDSEFVDGADTWRRNLSFDDPGTYTVSVAVADALGQRTRERHEVRVVSVSSNGSGSSGVGSVGGGGFASSLPDSYISYASDGDSLVFSGIDSLYLADGNRESLALSPSNVRSGLSRVSDRHLDQTCPPGTSDGCSNPRDVTVTGKAAGILADQLEINSGGLRAGFTSGSIDTEELDRKLGSETAENERRQNSGEDTNSRYSDNEKSSNDNQKVNTGWRTDSPTVDWRVEDNNNSGGDSDDSSDSSSSSSDSGWSTDSPTVDWSVDEASDTSSSSSDENDNSDDSSSSSSDDGGIGDSPIGWHY